MTVVSLPMAILGIVVLFISIFSNNGAFVLPSMVTIILFAITSVAMSALILADALYRKRLRRLCVYEFLEIVDTTQIKDNPKVLYIYTCHNDFIESRVVYNMNQTYKNMEVWISDGSDKEEISNQIKTIALKHSINYFKVGPNGSKNKAENINTFLKAHNIQFDYLLLTDSDEVLEPNFVEYALKCFSSNRFRNVGYITPINFYYGGASLFTSILSNQVTARCWLEDYPRVFGLQKIPYVYSCSCLVSSKLLSKTNNLLPEGCLEDYYLEYAAVNSGFVALNIPITTGAQEFDRTIQANITRVLRILDWQIKLFKTNVFKDYNEKFPKWYAHLLAVTFSVPAIVFAYLFLPWVLFFVVYNAEALFTNALFITMLACGVLLITITIISYTVIDSSKKTIIKKDCKCLPLFIILYGLSFVGPLFVHWWNSMIRGKYSDFTPSAIMGKKQHKIKTPLLLCVISFVVLALFIVLFSIFVGYSNRWLLLPFFYVTILALLIFVCSLAYLILHWASKKIVHPNYNVQDLVYPADFYKFESIKQQYESNKGKAVNHD